MLEYSVKRSGRRSISLEVTREGNILVRAPYAAAKKQIEELLRRYEPWLNKQLAARRAAPPPPDFGDEEREALITRAREYLPGRVKYFAGLMALEPTGITITGAQTRYGSCSAKNRLCFSWRLMQYPDGAVDSVVVHELAHIAHKNHGPDFYALIYSVMPDYKERKKLLHGLRGKFCADEP